MYIDIDSVIQSLNIFTNEDSRFLHSCMGISDKDAEKIFDNAQDIVTGYLQTDGEWEVTDVLNDLLVATKFHRLNSTQALLFLLHGYYTLSVSINPSYLLMEDNIFKNGEIEINQN